MAEVIYFLIGIGCLIAVVLGAVLFMKWESKHATGYYQKFKQDDKENN